VLIIPSSWGSQLGGHLHAIKVVEENGVGGVWITGSLVAAALVERVVRQGEGRGVCEVRVSGAEGRGREGGFDPVHWIGTDVWCR
jgi:hypothetical protein